MQRMSDDNLKDIYVTNPSRIWVDRSGKEECKCFRCAKPIKTIVELPAKDGNGRQTFGMDCYLMLKHGKKKPKAKAAHNREVYEHLSKIFLDECLGPHELTTKMVGEYYCAEIDGKELKSPTYYGFNSFVNSCKYAIRESFWKCLEYDYENITGCSAPREAWLVGRVRLKSISHEGLLLTSEDLNAAK